MNAQCIPLHLLETGSRQMSVAVYVCVMIYFSLKEYQMKDGGTGPIKKELTLKLGKVPHLILNINLIQILNLILQQTRVTNVAGDWKFPA